MNIVFFGSDNFAAPSLRAILDTKHRILCVVTQPDRKSGRGLPLIPTAIKNIALESHLNIYQPIQVNSTEAIKFLKDLNPDLFVVIAYGQILSKRVLDIPKIMPINVHASILPKYRGAAPINWAIIKGERTTGITIIKMTQNLDAGSIILKDSTDIKDDDDSITLEYRLSQIAAELLINALELIENNSYRLTPQDESNVTFAPKLKKEDGLINWSKSAGEIYNLVRAILDWPGAFTYYNGKLLKIYKAKVSGQKDIPVSLGEIVEVSKKGICVVTGKDNLIIEELQIEGKRKMTVGEFIAGHKIRPGEILGKK